MASGIKTSNQVIYNVSTPIYDGPLDLLLQLIERAELDITALAIAKVTDQYLEHLKIVKEFSVGDVSSFLVIAARLIQIKSEALLPRPVVREEGEEDPGDELARQLVLYKSFKDIAQVLNKYQSAGLHTYLRYAPTPDYPSKIDPDIILSDLVAAAEYVFSQEIEKEDINTVVKPLRITIREKIDMISGKLKSQGSVIFNAITNKSEDRLDIVITFLALLELIKRHLVDISQDELFGEIEISPTNAWSENQEFDIDFEES